MAFELEQVVPWGRSYDEYVAMFALSRADRGKKIVGCGDGPASFNAELTERGGTVVSVDPIYRFSSRQIAGRIEETASAVLEQIEKNEREFVWKNIESPRTLLRIRMNAMRRFLSDFPGGREEGRYVVGELPSLAFADEAFDLALCSHLLFLYSEHLSLDFHVRSIVEMCRVADEARVFPLVELGAKRSRHLDRVVERLHAQGYACRVEEVDYEFQRGGNEMLRVMAPWSQAGK